MFLAKAGCESPVLLRIATTSGQSRAEGVRQQAAGRLEVGRCLHNDLQAAHVRNSVGVSGAPQSMAPRPTKSGRALDRDRNRADHALVARFTARR